MCTALIALGENRALYRDFAFAIGGWTGAKVLASPAFGAASFVASCAAKEMDDGRMQNGCIPQGPVRIALTSGLSRSHIADDLGVGVST
jgi:hypothetical protein